jgi:hypothetical protein
MIIDMHMHIEEVPSLGWKMSADDCIRAMDAAGVDRAAVMTLTDLPGLNPAGLELIADARARAIRTGCTASSGFIRLIFSCRKTCCGRRPPTSASRA